MAALLDGAACLLSLDPEHLAVVTAQSRFRLHKAFGGVTYLGFHFLQPQWQDERVRQAIAMAINKAALVATGPFEIAHTPLSQAMTGYDVAAAAFAYPYDPASSRQLLEAAHFDFSAEIVLLYPESHTYRRLAELIVQQLSAIGIDHVRLRETPRTDISNHRHQFDLLLFDYAWGDYTALSIFLGPGARNLLSYPNGDVAALVQQAHGASTSDQRQALLLEAQRIVLQDAVWQPLVVRHLTFAADSRCLHGERQSPFGELLLHDAWTE